MGTGTRFWRHVSTPPCEQLERLVQSCQRVAVAPCRPEHSPNDLLIHYCDAPSGLTRRRLAGRQAQHLAVKRAGGKSSFIHGTLGGILRRVYLRYAIGC